ncbi:PaaI family thioesterase [Variovorax dokdonensis]|uniref:PaaI family thioesterase n=1 Tax=Variovorax dokdonensis TaxID=344883 RepID=A0ABT7N4S2_9BURK|nr:PaaI family thioesterase [Variovorax dokdonensis]MDM0042918.1 PaaI family thioesterase [Variovorax dokdonensis]
MQPGHQTRESLSEAGWRERTLSGFADRMGPLWTRKEEDGWAYGILAGAEHLNPAGFVHGGVLCALFDHMISAVAWEAAGRQPCVTVQLGTQFLAAAREGQFLEARGRVTRLASTLVFAEGAIATGEVEVLRGTSVQKIMPRPAA